MAFEAGWLREALERHPEATEPGIKVAGAVRRGRKRRGGCSWMTGPRRFFRSGWREGCDPTLKPGDLVIADRILSAGAPDMRGSDWRMPCWRGGRCCRICRDGPDPDGRSGRDQRRRKRPRSIAIPARARWIWRATAWPKAAAAAKVPFLAVRAIGDGPERACRGSPQGPSARRDGHSGPGPGRASAPSARLSWA